MKQTRKMEKSVTSKKKTTKPIMVPNTSDIGHILQATVHYKIFLKKENEYAQLKDETNKKNGIESYFEGQNYQPHFYSVQCGSTYDESKSFDTGSDHYR